MEIWLKKFRLQSFHPFRYPVCFEPVGLATTTAFIEIFVTCDFIRLEIAAKTHFRRRCGSDGVNRVVDHE